MPFVPETQLVSLRNAAQNAKNRAVTAGKKVKEAETTGRLFALGEGVAGAVAAGYARGKWGDSTTGQWVVPGTEIDVELLAFVGLLGVAIVGDQVGLKAYQSHAQNFAVGVGAHYFGQVARQAAKTGEWTLVSGGAAAHIGSGLPQYDPTSYDPTQFAAPYDDPTASALASSGV